MQINYLQETYYRTRCIDDRDYGDLAKAYREQGMKGLEKRCCAPHRRRQAT